MLIFFYLACPLALLRTTRPFYLFSMLYVYPVKFAYGDYFTGALCPGPCASCLMPFLLLSLARPHFRICSFTPDL